MNIKTKNGKVVHCQKHDHITVCGRSLTIRIWDTCFGRFKTVPNFIETEEEITCEKCKMALKSNKNIKK